MTVPHDEQPLTRRALRELERQKPRKQQESDAGAADEAEVRREPVIQLGHLVPATENSSAVPFAPAAEASELPATPALSRRARRALSSDHPFADQPAAGQAAGDPSAGDQPAGDQTAGRPRDPSTGPIIAEIIPEPPATDSIEVFETGAVETVEPLAEAGRPASDDTSEVAVPVVEELLVVDKTVDPEVASQEDEEFAEIDDTVAPEAVHVITIDENPSGPILSPLFPAATDREVTRVDPTDSSFDNLIASRGVGASNSVSTTSALVLPSVPHHGDVGTALDETGEVIITGSIDLPMSLGLMGAAPADGLESSELDAYLDPDGDVGSDVAPVSATRAVSTHGTTSGLVAPPKRGRANAPVILGVIAGVLAVGVVGLLIAAFAFKIF